MPRNDIVLRLGRTVAPTGRPAGVWGAGWRIRGPDLQIQRAYHAQPRPGHHVRIDLRRGHIRVPEQIPQRADIHARLQQVRQGVTRRLRSLAAPAHPNVEQHDSGLSVRASSPHSIRFATFHAGAFARSLRGNVETSRLFIAPFLSIRICFGFRASDFVFPAPPRCVRRASAVCRGLLQLHG